MDFGILRALALCAWYIVLSASLISFNKHLINKDRFPYPLALTTIHMATTCVLSVTCYTVCPSWYPSMGKAVEKRSTLLKYLVPIACLFSASLWMSNKAYAYSTVAFLQFIKEANLTVVYLLSCLCGLQTLKCQKIGIILWIIAGCSLCVHGEINFVLAGLVLQVVALLCECSKNVMGELVLSGNDLKLDPLTFNFFQAPLTFIPLAMGVIFTCSMGWSDGLLVAFKQNWKLILPNSMMAFVLNITLTAVIKHLSAVSFVLTGLVKDMAIVLASGAVFGDYISIQQLVGFSVTIAGVGCWSHLRLVENTANTAKGEEKSCRPEEETPLLHKPESGKAS